MMISPQVSWLFLEAVRAGLAVKRPYLDSYGSSESGGRRTEKQPTGRGPEGCVENGPAGEACRRIGVSAFAKHASTPIRRYVSPVGSVFEGNSATERLTINLNYKRKVRCLL